MSRQNNWERALEKEQGETYYSHPVGREDFKKLQDRSGPGFITVEWIANKSNLEEFEREGLAVTVFYDEKISEEDEDHEAATRRHRLPARVTYLRILQGPTEKGKLILQLVLERINLPPDNENYDRFDWGQ